jgi:predicted metal-binding protein
MLSAASTTMEGCGFTVCGKRSGKRTRYPIKIALKRNDVNAGHIPGCLTSISPIDPLATPVQRMPLDHTTQ